LRKLYLDANEITKDGANYIADYLNYMSEHNMKGITALWVSMNKLDDEGCIKIANAVKNYPYMKRLCIASNMISSIGLRDILNALQNHPSLIMLDIGAYKATKDMGVLPNNVGDEGAYYIGEYLKNNRKLQLLDISQNGISDNGMALVINGYLDNDSLLYIYYDQYGQDITTKTKNMLYDNMERNLQNNYDMSVPEFHKRNLRLLKHGNRIEYIDSIYRNKM